MSQRVAAFLIGDPAHEPELLSRLGASFDVERQATTSEELVWFDTFDRRLARRGARLCAVGKRREQALDWRRDADALVRRFRTNRAPAFVADLPAGTLREELAPVIDVRRLLPAVQVRRTTRRLAVLDGEEKTVVRVALEEGDARAPSVRGEWRPLAPRLVVREVKGYGDDFERLTGFVERTLGLPRTRADELERAEGALGGEPFGRRAAAPFVLAAGMSATDALRGVLRSMLDVIEENEDGVRRDLDPEFLHDLRVAVRRSRSALGLVRGVFPEAVTTHYGGELRWLGSATGPTRDLDVFLTKADAYSESFDEEVRLQLAPLLEFMARRRGVEHARTVRALDSRRYRELVANWRAFLEDTSTNGSHRPNAHRAIEEVARERILRRHRKVRKAARAIGTDAPAAALHALRIDCKKLRYLLEIFGSLLDAKRARKAIKALKRMQELLGDLNDLATHRRLVESSAAAMSEGEGTGAVTMLAAGRFAGHLDRELEELRAHAHERIEGWLSSGATRRFERWLGGEPNAGEGRGA